MNNRELRYIRLHDVAAYESAGWRVCRPGLAGTHHGRYSELMVWPGEGDPVIPDTEHYALAGAAAVVEGE